jgi:hypothetical protein
VITAEIEASGGGTVAAWDVGVLMTGVDQSDDAYVRQSRNLRRTCDSGDIELATGMISASGCQPFCMFHARASCRLMAASGAMSAGD